MKKYICVDIGGTQIKHGILNEDETFVTKGKTDTEAHLGGPSLLKKVLGIVENYVEMLAQSGEKPEAVCISTAGMVNTDDGSIYHSAPLIPNYIGINYKKAVEEQFGLPCEVENDVNCAGMAEYGSGAGKGFGSMLMLTIGTGIGGCFVDHGHVFHGSRYSACEVGYMPLPGGQFQDLAAASILSKNVADRTNDLTGGNETPADWNGIRIFAEAKAGNVICTEEISRMCDTLGQGIASICYVLNPEVVVLGGGIMAQKEYLEPQLQAAIRRHLLPIIADHTKLAFAAHENDAGMIGAYYSFKGARDGK